MAITPSARRHQESERTLASRQIAEIERKLQHLLDALSEGIRAPGLQGKLDQLEADRRRLDALLRQPAPEPVRLHPNLAELYRKQIEGLHRALVHPATRDEAFAILRQLIERVSVHPHQDGVEIELQGEIVGMVEVALGSDATSPIDSKTALRRLMLDDGFRRSVKVVAGTRYQRDLHLNWVAI